MNLIVEDMKKHRSKSSTISLTRDKVTGIAKIAILLIIFFSTIIFTFYAVEQKNQKNSIINDFVQQEEAYLAITSVAVEKDIAKMVQQLLTIRDLTSFYVGQNSLKEVEQFYLSIANNHDIFDQIRYIDETGVERARINYVDNKGVVVEKNQLQDKSERYYFQNSYNLEYGQIYISPLDLNIEENVVEIPHKPMMRFATPICDEDGNKRGIVILNFLASNILNLIETVSRGYEVHLSLVNQEGYFLIHEEDRSKEFGFMFEDRKDSNLEIISPSLYTQAQENNSGWCHHEKGLFTFNRIYPFEHKLKPQVVDKAPHLSPTSRSWTIITHIPENAIAQKSQQLGSISIFGFILILLFIVSVSIVLSTLWYQKITDDKYVKNLAHYDQLTGCFNRAWGLKILGEVITKAKKGNVMVALLFVDLDKFKGVNDTYGHKAGDVVLVESVKRIKNCLRSDDIIIRLGGDEFLVILPSVTNPLVPMEVAERIHKVIREEINYGNILLHIDSSIGIALYPKDGTHVNELISHSDSAMYQAKTKKGSPIVQYEKKSLTQ